MAKKDYTNWDRKDLIKEIEQLRKRKKYGLVWEDKPENVVEQCKTELPVLEEVKSKEIITDPEKPVNLLIEGDNYHALSVLNYTHKGKIDVIYIDPPYNTGNKDFKYNDDYVDSEDMFRHSKWISFMEKRLKLAKNILSKNGVIFISIDDNEFAQLKFICDEIFGETNLIGVFTWVRKKKGSNLSKEFRKITEYVLAYKSARGQVSLYGQAAYAEKQVPLLNRPNNISVLHFEAGKIFFGNGAKDGKIKKGVFGSGELVVELLNDIELKDKIIQTPFSIKGRFRWSQKTVDEELENGSVFTVSNTFRINVARYNQADKFKSPSSLLTPDDGIGTNEDATEELRNIFPENEKLPFDYPKPVSLIEFLIASVVRESKEAIVCDFMAGSGTTGQAVLNLNKTDNGNRKFILCTNNELNGFEKELRNQGLSELEIQEHGICRRVTWQRLERVINGYLNSKKEKVEGIIGNLKYFRTSFVPADPTDKNKIALTEKATEMLCIKEDTFEKIKSTKQYKIFRNKKRYTGIIFDHQAIDDFKKEIAKIDGKFSLYIFSLSNDDYLEEFLDLKKKVKLSPIPEAILKVYREIFKFTRK